MTIYEAIGAVTLRELLGEIDSGQTVLPNFQRDFVWDPAATQGLLVSVANQHPAGSILRVRDGQRAFATRPFVGAPEPHHLHTFLVLDGQQRLTSLYQALYGVGEVRYFIDLAKAFEDPELDGEETVFFRRKNRRGTEELESDTVVQARDRVLPLSVIQKREGGFWKWLADIRVLIDDPDDAADFEAKARTLYQQRLCHFDSYQFPVVTLRETVSAASLCTIFETINMNGVRLTSFELLTARVWRFGINLREKWEKALEVHPILGDYDVDPYYALQALSLMATGSCQKKAVLGLEADHITANWDLVVSQMAKAFEILKDDCGIMTRAWLPTPSMIGPLTAILVAASDAAGAAAGARRLQITRWIWCAMFGRRYEAAANTRAEKDYREMKEWFDGGDVPETISLFRFDKETLREVATKSSPIYKSVICLSIASEPKARDFHERTVISETMVRTRWVDDHHIFPRAFLRNEQGITNKTLIDCVLNRTLIDRTTNRVISDRAPSEYLADLDPHVDTDEILQTHLIPVGPNSPLRLNDYEAFLDLRADLVMEKIKGVTS